jgi:tetratricopeptide (TPR) repeat protein
MTGRVVIFCSRTLSCLLLILTLSAQSSLANDNATASDADLTSDAAFNKAVQAVKQKNYADALNIFEAQADASQHDAQYNLAILLQAGKGRPQNFQQALIWAWSAVLGGIEEAIELADELTDMIPEKALEEARESLRDKLQKRIDDGDRSAVMQFASYHTLILEEADFETAYVWYSIAAAIGEEGSIEARDDAQSKVDDEEIVTLQLKAGTIFEGLTFKN